MSKKTAKKQKKESERFVEGLKKRGEVIDRTKNKKDVKSTDDLPSGVTHEIVGYDKAGKPIVKRRRFTSF